MYVKNLHWFSNTKKYINNLIIKCVMKDNVIIIVYQSISFNIIILIFLLRIEINIIGTTHMLTSEYNFPSLITLVLKPDSTDSWLNLWPSILILLLIIICNRWRNLLSLLWLNLLRLKTVLIVAWLILMIIFCWINRRRRGKRSGMGWWLRRCWRFLVWE